MLPRSPCVFIPAVARFLITPPLLVPTTSTFPSHLSLSGVSLFILLPPWPVTPSRSSCAPWLRFLGSVFRLVRRFLSDQEGVITVPVRNQGIQFAVVPVYIEDDTIIKRPPAIFDFKYPQSFSLMLENIHCLHMKWLNSFLNHSYVDYIWFLVYCFYVHLRLFIYIQIWMVLSKIIMWFVWGHNILVSD